MDSSEFKSRQYVGTTFWKPILVGSGEYPTYDSQNLVLNLAPVFKKKSVKKLERFEFHLRVHPRATKTLGKRSADWFKWIFAQHIGV